MKNPDSTIGVDTIMSVGHRIITMKNADVPMTHHGIVTTGNRCRKLPRGKDKDMKRPLQGGLFIFMSCFGCDQFEPGGGTVILPISGAPPAVAGETAGEGV